MNRVIMCSSARITLLLAFLLAGCGNKGPLVAPEPVPLGKTTLDADADRPTEPKKETK